MAAQAARSAEPGRPCRRAGLPDCPLSPAAGTFESVPNGENETRSSAGASVDGSASAAASAMLSAPKGSASEAAASRSARTAERSGC